MKKIWNIWLVNVEVTKYKVWQFWSVESSALGPWYSGSETVLYTIKGEVGYMVVTVGKATGNETCLSKINKQGETYMLPLKW